MRKALIGLVFLCLSVSAVAQQPTPSASSGLQGLDSFIDNLREEWRMPGLAVGIVRDGKVVLAGGYGYRDLEHKLPVTSKTLFPIGSTSKSFTALALAILKDQGKVDWDKPVRQYLPAFQLQDAVASERMTLRDLLTHRSGLARHDLLWYSSRFTRKQMFDRLRYLEMGPGFRNTFQYNNLMYMTAGYLAGEVSGLGWEGLVQQSILEPLEMNSTNFRDAESQKSNDYALPYDEVKGEVQQIPFKPLDAIAPAGGINSNLDGMLHYVLMLLAQGKYGENQIVSPSSLKQIQSPQIIMGVAPRHPELGYPTYGMGWVIQTYRGHSYVWHNGGIDGFYTLLGLLPDDHIGVVVLTNRLDRAPAEILARHIFDRLLGLEPVSWDQRFKDELAEAKKADAEQKRKASSDHKLGTHPAHALQDYAGKYEHPAYGTVTITVIDDSLALTLNELMAPLEHYHFEVFATPEGNKTMPPFKLRFSTGMNGEVESVAIPLQAGVNEIVFQRVQQETAPPGALPK